MQREVLGTIEIQNGDPYDAVARVSHGGREVDVQISGDNQPLEVAIALAADVVVRLNELDHAAKQVACANLREQYNDGWNEYDEAQEDGSFRTVVNPQLSEAEFIAKLSLDAISVTGKTVVEFYYDNENLFWGHTVIVTSLNGADLSEAYAELFG